MKEGITLTAMLLAGCIAAAICGANSEGMAPEEEKHQAYRAIDLSTPEKAVHYFYEAFLKGDDELLSEVLAPAAIVTEFNPLQKIVSPHPSPLDFEIVKKEIVTAESSDGVRRPGDIELYVRLECESKRVTNGGAAMLDERPSFLLREIDGRWKIVMVAPFW